MAYTRCKQAKETACKMVLTNRFQQLISLISFIYIFIYTQQNMYISMYTTKICTYLYTHTHITYINTHISLLLITETWHSSAFWVEAENLHRTVRLFVLPVLRYTLLFTIFRAHLPYRWSCSVPFNISMSLRNINLVFWRAFYSWDDYQLGHLPEGVTYLFSSCLFPQMILYNYWENKEKCINAHIS